MRGALTAAAALLFGLGSTGCAGWVRANGGYAYSASGRVDHSGPMVGADTILTPKPHTFWNKGSKAFPVGLHTGLEFVDASELKSISWTTGAAYFSKPRPIGGYVILGTNGHYDFIGGRSSFGNFQPYAEIGVASPLTDRDEDVDGPLLTLGLEYMLIYSYLAQPDDRLTNLLIFKFGFGWEKN